MPCYARRVLRRVPPASRGRRSDGPEPPGVLHCWLHRWCTESRVSLLRTQLRSAKLARARMMKRWWIPLLVAWVCVAGCGGSVATDSTSGTTGGTSGGVQPVPEHHRSAPVACPEERAAGDPIVNQHPPNQCAQDSDCNAGINGRCLWFHASYCSYDTCFNDSDCSDNGVCACRLANNNSNSCVEGNCRVDADCGQGAFCSPSQLGNICGYDASLSSSGYFCHTVNDSCVEDSNCDSQSTCAYTQQNNRWACVPRSVCF